MKKSKIFLAIGTVFFAAAIGIALYNTYNDRQAEKQSEVLFHRLEEIIPTHDRNEAPNDTAVSEILPPIFDETRIPEEDSSSAPPISNETQIPEDKPAPPPTPEYILFPDMEMPEATIDGYSYIGTLSIPVLNIKLPIMSKWSYKGLKIAPGRYSGSVYSHDLIICGHNYAAFFHKLKNMPLGEKLYFTDMNGNEFIYTAVSLETLEPSDIEYMISGDWDMTIFTCTIGGARRVTLRCVLDN